MHLLTSPHWRLWLDPTQGVRWCALQANHEQQWLHVTPDCRGPHTGASGPVSEDEPADEPGPAAGLLNAASFLMLPYSNRIRDARFSFEGQEHQLEDAEAHAIHGALRKLPWQVENASDTHLLCRFDSREHERAGHAPINWPWPLEATFEHTLSDRLLQSAVAVTNRGDTPMPVGLGWHPYFLREIKGAAPHLTVPVDAVFPDASGDCLPDGAAVELTGALDFRNARALDPAQRIDHCFAGLSGDIKLAWPDAHLSLSLRASDNCRFAIVYNPDEPFFAVEPVSNANDAFNLEARGIDAGTHVLAPGETLSATLELELDTPD
jgi:aldose 1-epimerase